MKKLAICLLALCATIFAAAVAQKYRELSAAATRPHARPFIKYFEEHMRPDDPSEAVRIIRRIRYVYPQSAVMEETLVDGDTSPVRMIFIPDVNGGGINEQYDPLTKLATTLLLSPPEAREFVHTTPPTFGAAVCQQFVMRYHPNDGVFDRCQPGPRVQGVPTMTTLHKLDPTGARTNISLGFAPQFGWEKLTAVATVDGQTAPFYSLITTKFLQTTPDPGLLKVAPGTKLASNADLYISRMRARHEECAPL